MEALDCSFKVFGCGLPRTGTYSLSKALEQLLGGKCHHAFTVVLERGQEHLNFWTAFSRSEPKDIRGLRQFLLTHGYTAGVDLPITYHVTEMLQAFPNAKVILTVRDTKAWYKSYNHVIGMFHRNRKMLGMGLLEKFNGKSDFHDTVEDKMRDMIIAGDEGKDAAIAYFNSWIDRIKQVVPPHKLLIYNVKEGWEPLCKFLDVPVPDYPFPHLNRSSDINDLVRSKAIPVYACLLVALSITIACCSYVVHGMYVNGCCAQSDVTAIFTIFVLSGLILFNVICMYKLNRSVGQYTGV